MKEPLGSVVLLCLVLGPMALVANLFKLQTPVHTSPGALLTAKAGEKSRETAALSRLEARVGVLLAHRAGG